MVNVDVKAFFGSIGGLLTTATRGKNVRSVAAIPSNVAAAEPIDISHATRSQPFDRGGVRAAVCVVLRGLRRCCGVLAMRMA